MAVYSSRIYATGYATGFGTVAAYSYAGPALNYAAERAGATGYFNAARLARWGEKAVDLAGRRVYLLLRVARFNAIGLALTGAELAYYGYVKHIADNALQEWCAKSTFRVAKKKTSFLGITQDTDSFAAEEDEIKALEHAAGEVSL